MSFFLFTTPLPPPQREEHARRIQDQVSTLQKDKEEIDALIAPLKPLPEARELGGAYPDDGMAKLRNGTLPHGPNIL